MGKLMGLSIFIHPVAILGSINYLDESQFLDNKV